MRLNTRHFIGISALALLLGITFAPSFSPATGSARPEAGQDRAPRGNAPGADLLVDMARGLGSQRLKVDMTLIGPSGLYWDGERVTSFDMTGSEYQGTFTFLANHGYRLIDVEGYTVDDQTRYAAIWEENDGRSWVARHGMSGSQYQSYFNQYVGQGFRLTHVSGYEVGGYARYAAIWEKRSGGAWVARHGMTSSQYQSYFNQYVNQGYRLIDVSGYEVNGTAYYAAIWEKKSGGAWVARHGMTSSQYQSYFNQYASQGYTLIHVSGYTVNGTDYYAAIWEKTGQAYVARHRMTASDFDYYLSLYDSQGYVIHDVSGYSLYDEERYAAIWVK